MAAQRLSILGRKRLNEFTLAFHKAAGVNPGEEFALEPRVLQTLHEKIIEQGHWFLNAINVTGVPEVKGSKIHMSVPGLVAGRTNTSGDGERKPRVMHALDQTEYELYATESDIAIEYKTIDTWKFFRNFAAMYQKQFRDAIANDRVRVGWHGTSAPETTDRVTNPNGEDVNIGWLELARTSPVAANHVDSGGLVVGAGGDVANLDSLVSQLKTDNIDKPFKALPGMVALVSEDLLGSAHGRYYESSGSTPSEKIHLDQGRILETYGGLRTIVPPFLPDGTVIVTPLANLSIYFQEDSWRRTLKDKPEKNAYQDFNSRNEGYVIEQLGAFAMAENVTFAA